MAERGTGDPLVTAALIDMAILRQADPSLDTLDYYSASLVEDGIESADVIAACERIGKTERADGETTFPSYGTLLRVCRDVRKDRQAEQQRALAARAPKRLAAPIDDTPLTREEAKAFVSRLKADVLAIRKGGRSNGIR